MQGLGSHDPRFPGGTVGDTGKVAVVVGDMDVVAVTVVEDGDGDTVREDLMLVSGSGSVAELV